MADTLTISRHLRTPEIRSFMTVAAVEDLSGADQLPPPAVDETGRSSQIFVVEVVVRSGTAERHAVASGRDIYAISAPLVVEAAERVIGSLGGKAGVFSAGEIFDAADFLMSLTPKHLSYEISDGISKSDF
jgi:hypothetical protein